MTDVREDAVVERVLEALREAGLSVPAIGATAIAATGRIPDVVDGEIIESAWGNAIRSRTVTPFVNAADRDAATAPPEGAYCVTLDNGQLWRRTATTWVPATLATTYSVTLGGTLPNSTANVTIGTLAIPSAPYVRTMKTDCVFYVGTTATAAIGSTITESAGGQTRILRGTPNISAVMPPFVTALAANTACTYTVVANFLTAPGATGSVPADARFCRLDVTGTPAT